METLGNGPPKQILSENIPEFDEKKNKTPIINKVVRGGSANLNKNALSRTGYNQELSDDFWGFRAILYKKD